MYSSFPSSGAVPVAAATAALEAFGSRLSQRPALLSGVRSTNTCSPALCAGNDLLGDRAKMSSAASPLGASVPALGVAPSPSNSSKMPS